MLFVSDIFPDVRLMKSHHGHGICMPALGRRSRSDAEAQGQVVHGVDNHTLVFIRVLSYSAQTGFHDVVTVEVLLLGRALQPDLVLGVGGHVIQSRDV